MIFLFRFFFKKLKENNYWLTQACLKSRKDPYILTYKDLYTFYLWHAKYLYKR